MRSERRREPRTRINRRSTAITLGIRMDSKGTYSAAHETYSAYHGTGNQTDRGALSRHLPAGTALNFLRRGFGNASESSLSPTQIFLLDLPGNTSKRDPIKTTIDEVLSQIEKPYELIILTNRQPRNLSIRRNVKVRYQALEASTSDDQALNDYLQERIASAHRITVERNKTFDDFRNALDELQSKCEEFEERERREKIDLESAKGEAEALHEKLSTYMKNFEKSRRLQGDYQHFRSQVMIAVKNSREILEQHRGWRQILTNIALAVAGLGVFYIAGCVIHYKLTGSFFYNPPTDSSRILDDVEHSLQLTIPSITTNSA